MPKIYGQMEKAQLENTTSDTASPEGSATYRTDLNLPKVTDGTTFHTLVDEDTAQTLTNKTFTTPTVEDAGVLQEIATPANPAAGYHKVYMKADGKMYMLDSAGVEQEVGTGSGLTSLSSSVHTSSGTWNVPAGVTEVIIEAYGGGGGGGAAFTGDVDNVPGASGGGGGAGPIPIRRSVTPGETITITIGSGGAGGTVITETGSTGGTTIVSSATLGTLNFYGGTGGHRGGGFSNYYKAMGGKGSGSGGSGGQWLTTSTASVTQGFYGGPSVNYLGGTSSSGFVGGGGGAGGGGAGANGVSSGNGLSAAANSGAGGGGTNSGYSGFTRIGGAGGSGKVTFYYEV